MLKVILKEWLLANCDCGRCGTRTNSGDLAKPDMILFYDRASVDVNALAQFILDNPCTD